MWTFQPFMKTARECPWPTCAALRRSLGMSVMKAADLPPCPNCAALPPDSSAPREDYRDVQHLTTSRALEPFEIGVTDVRHVIEENDLLAVYEIHEADVVLCSNPQRHRHWEGVVVRTRCGRTICMGKECGVQLIENFARIDEVKRRAREYNSFLSFAKGELTALGERRDAALKRCRALIDFRTLIEGELGWFIEGVQRRRKLVFPGVELFDGRRNEIERNLGDLRDLEWALPAWERKLPPLSEQRAIRQRLKVLGERLDDFEGWARVAARVTTRAGFDEALEALDSDDELVDVEEFNRDTGEVVTRKRGRRRRMRVSAEVTDDGIVDRASGRTVPVVWTR